MGVKERFVQQVLQEEGTRMLRRQEAGIRATLKSRTGRLLSERDVSIRGGAGMDGNLEFRHMDYQRFLDIPARGLGKKKKRRKIHNRYTYGAYASIAERLMYGLTEGVAEEIRKTSSSWQK